MATLTTLRLSIMTTFWQLVDNLAFCVCPPDNTRQPPDICQMYGHWYTYVWCIRCGTCMTSVWWELTDVWWGMWQSSDRGHQTITVWRKGWGRASFSVTCGAGVTALSTHRDVIGWISLEALGQWRSHVLIKFVLVVFLIFLLIKDPNEYVSLSIHWAVDYHSVQQTQTICVTNTSRQLYAEAKWPQLLQ